MYFIYALVLYDSLLRITKKSRTRMQKPRIYIAYRQHNGVYKSPGGKKKSYAARSFPLGPRGILWAIGYMEELLATPIQRLQRAGEPWFEIHDNGSRIRINRRNFKILFLGHADHGRTLRPGYPETLDAIEAELRLMENWVDEEDSLSRPKA